MLQATRQRFQVESGRLLRIVDLEDPDTGAADQQVDDVGDAPPGATEGDSAENPEDLIKSSPDYYPGAGSSNDTGFPGFSKQLAQGMQAAYGGGAYGSGLPADYTGYGGGTSGSGGGSSVGNNISDRAGQYINPGTAAAQGINQAPGSANGLAGTPSQTMPGQPGSVNTQGVSGGAANADIMRNQILYNTDDPTTALNNALMDMGVNPFNPGNPFVQFMQRAAPGLAAAFQLQNALGGATGQSAANQPDAFKQFLGNSLAGGHTLSGLAGATSLIPQVVAKLRSTAAGGTTAGEVNPFLNAIGSVLASGFGEGTAGVLAALLGPTMNRGLAGGYKTGLERALALSQRNYDYNNPKADIWQFLLGQ